jgi:exodeoxyribonuclease V alpha subunit
MNELRQLICSSAFSDLDRHFAGFIEAQAGGDYPLLSLAAALTSRTRTEGHICLNLQSMAETSFPEKPGDGLKPVQLPKLAAWIKELKASQVVGSPGQFSPLVMDAKHRLYFHRYWEYEQTLAAEILKRSSGAWDDSNNEALGQRLKALFAAESSGSVNLQSVAAFAAARGKFCVISGGPGTGKTHALVLILALLLELDPNRKLRIAVTAPTGKAATRIQESIRSIKATLASSEETKAQLPEAATTIHRLLGYIPDSAYFRHNADNLLPFDVVAVDEASMVDLALMSKLFQAVPLSARVILLGDRDQLASVEAGAVLGDICSAVSVGDYSKPFSQHFEKLTGQQLPGGAGVDGTAQLGDCVVQLKKNYRFGEHSPIFQLSTAINEGHAEHVFGILRSSSGDAKSDLIAAALPGRAKLKEALKGKVVDGFSNFLKASDPLQAIVAMSRFRVLCALREGPFGVAGLNQTIEEILEEAGLIRCRSPWYSHRPIMITRNDYNLKVFNGDNGVILSDGGSGEARAFFSGPDNSLRQFLPIRLPEHETAYAMTVHKSQGSEFDRILLILPDRQSPVLTRELLYTGISRARKSVELWFEEQVFRAALSQRVRRTSGLCDALAQIGDRLGHSVTTS